MCVAIDLHGVDLGLAYLNLEPQVAQTVLKEVRLVVGALGYQLCLCSNT